MSLEPLAAIVLSSLLGIPLLVGAMAVARLPWPLVAKLGAAPPVAWLGGLFDAVSAVVTVLTLWRGVGCAMLLGGIFLI